MKIEDADIETFRDPTNYLAWFNSLLAQANADPKTKGDALRHKGEFKFFYEEIFPIASLLKHKKDEWSSSRLRHIRGNQNHDVEMTNNELQYLEIVSAYFDEAELFRMNEFIREGHVDALAEIERDSNGKPVAISKKEGMHLHDGLITRILGDIEGRISSKSEKEYPDKTGLVVYFDDYKYYIVDDDYERFENLLEDTRAKWSRTFEFVFIVGPRSQKHFEKRK